MTEGWLREMEDPNRKRTVTWDEYGRMTTIKLKDNCDYRVIV